MQNRGAGEDPGGGGEHPRIGQKLLRSGSRRTPGVFVGDDPGGESGELLLEQLGQIVQGIFAENKTAGIQSCRNGDKGHG